MRVVQAFGREKAFTGRFRQTNEAQYDANMETIRIATRYFPFMETLGIVGHRAHHRARRAVRRPGHRHRRHRRRVRALPQQPVRAGAAAQPAVQHRPAVGRGAEQAVRAARRASRRSPSGPARSTSPPTGAIEVTDVVVRLRLRPRRAARRQPRHRAGRAARARRPHRRREVDAGQADRALLRPAPRCGDDGRRRPARRDACDSLRQRIVVVPQEGFLFTGTVRDNVRVGRPDATDAEVDAAIAALGVARALRRAARWARHRGARARVAACRAASASWCRSRAPRSPIPPSSCSTKPRRASTPAPSASVELALERLTENRTVVVVAHRLSTAARADRVGVVDDGMLAELGYARRADPPGRALRRAVRVVDRGVQQHRDVTRSAPSSCERVHRREVLLLAGRRGSRARRRWCRGARSAS